MIQNVSTFFWPTKNKSALCWIWSFQSSIYKITSGMQDVCGVVVHYHKQLHPPPTPPTPLAGYNALQLACPWPHFVFLYLHPALIFPTRLFFNSEAVCSNLFRDVSNELPDYLRLHGITSWMTVIFKECF